VMSSAIAESGAMLASTTRPSLLETARHRPRGGRIPHRVTRRRPRPVRRRALCRDRIGSAQLGAQQRRW
jgi:hypothetical protein